MIRLERIGPVPTWILNIRSADDDPHLPLVWGVTGKASELNITAEGLDPERLYTLRVYSLLDVPGRDPMDGRDQRFFIHRASKS